MNRPKSIKKPGVNIDMTPLVDVIMLLLTFFMLTATFKAETTEAIEVALPQSANTDSTKLPEKDIMTLTVTKSGDVYVDVDNYKVRKKVFGDDFGLGVFHPDSTSQSELQQTGKIQGKDIKRKFVMLNKEQMQKTLLDLRAALYNETEGKSDFRIVIKGDKDADFGVVEDLMEVLKTSKNNRFSLVTDYESPSKQ